MRRIGKCSVPDASNRVREINTLRDFRTLAIVERLKFGQSIRITLHQISKLVEKLSTLDWGDVTAPNSSEGFARRGDCDIDIILGS